MNPTEPKSQTPLTDAAGGTYNHLGQFTKRTDFADVVPVNVARSFEFKLQIAEAKLAIKDAVLEQRTNEANLAISLLKEAERQRDEAMQDLKNVAAQTDESNARWRKDLAERDQLIKVVDELAANLNLLINGDGFCGNPDKALDAYSLLPHVQAKKGNKQ